MFLSTLVCICFRTSIAPLQPSSASPWHRHRPASCLLGYPQLSIGIICGGADIQMNGCSAQSKQLPRNILFEIDSTRIRCFVHYSHNRANIRHHSWHRTTIQGRSAYPGHGLLTQLRRLGKPSSLPVVSVLRYFHRLRQVGPRCHNQYVVHSLHFD